MKVSGASSSTCPIQLAPLDQTSNNCTKLINAQVGCVTNVDSYSMHACTYLASVGDISKIVCYHQVLFAVVTKLQQFEEKATHMFAGSEFQKVQVQSTWHGRSQLYVTGKLPVCTVCSKFKHYVGLVNLPHSSACPMFPYIFEIMTKVFIFLRYGHFFEYRDMHALRSRQPLEGRC